jgi:MinD-like ATPase involved in chromosome partitioning or flagellar assembly
VDDGGRESVAVGYGARPVSVGLTRGRTLNPATDGPVQGRVVMSPPQPSRDRNAEDRLALKHWPRAHRVLVCSLTGGTGRTTVAALIAATLAGLPYAHHWPAALLVDGDPRRFDPSWPRHTNDRSEGPATPVGSQFVLRTAPAGLHLLQPHLPHRWIHPLQVQTALAAVADRYAPVIIDNPCGLPSESPWTTAAGFSVVLVVRPDEYSLAEAAEALTWTHDRQLFDKQQVIVVLNYGAGARTRRHIPAASALAIRCHGLHLLPADPHLGLGPTPPFARPVPDRLRLRLAQICLEIWHTTIQPPIPHHPGRDTAGPHQENQ